MLTSLTDKRNVLSFAQQIDALGPFQIGTRGTLVHLVDLSDLIWDQRRLGALIPLNSSAAFEPWNMMKTPDITAHWV